MRKRLVVLRLAALLLAGLMLASCAAAKDNDKEKDATPDAGSTAEETSGKGEETASETPFSESEETTPEPIDESRLDRFDYLNYENARTIEGQLYQNGLRTNVPKEIVFSLASYDLMWTLWGEEEAYTAYLLFTIPAKGDTPSYTFHSVEAKPKRNGWDSIDFILCGENVSAFCPTAEQKYTVEIALVKDSEPENVLSTGRYENVSAPKSMAKSQYYAPTEQTEPTVLRCFTLRYVAGEHGKVTGTLQQHIAPGYRSEKVTAEPDAGYEFICWSDGVSTPERSGDKPEKSLTITAFFANVKEDGIASVYLFTETGLPILKKEYEPGALAIAGAKNKNDNIAAHLQVKARGNSSFRDTDWMEWYESKNSYSIKLDEKEQLLGVGSGKSRKWVLNANKFDAVGLRNFFTWDIARRMGTIPYVPECTWVRLYLNGAYRGLYMLSEKVNVEKGRVEVNDELTGTTDKGYLIALDFRGNSLTDTFFYVNGYGPNPRKDAYEAVEFVIKSKTEGKKDVDFIKNYIQKCHDALMAGDRDEIDKLVDIPSLIDMFIISELSMDCDAGRASFYLSKEAGQKVYFTAPWDFDFGYGNYGVSAEWEGYVSDDGDNCLWFESLRSQEWFVTAVKARMNELSGVLDEAIKDLYATGREFRTGIDENAEHWNLYGRPYHEYIEYQSSAELHNLEEHLEFIENWTRSRWQWLLEN